MFLLLLCSRSLWPGRESFTTPASTRGRDPMLPCWLEATLWVITITSCFSSTQGSYWSENWGNLTSCLRPPTGSLSMGPIVPKPKAFSDSSGYSLTGTALWGAPRETDAFSAFFLHLHHREHWSDVSQPAVDDINPFLHFSICYLHKPSFTRLACYTHVLKRQLLVLYWLTCLTNQHAPMSGPAAVHWHWVPPNDVLRSTIVPSSRSADTIKRELLRKILIW